MYVLGIPLRDSLYSSSDSSAVSTKLTLLPFSDPWGELCGEDMTN